MPTRILREGILTSARVNKLSVGAEVFFRRLMSVADDYGRYSAHPSLLRAALFGYRLNVTSDKQIQVWLTECKRVGLVRIYSTSGQKYLEILRFGQQIRGKSKFPEPPGVSADGQPLSSCLATDEQLRPNPNGEGEVGYECEGE
jgi:hypothetical protein